MLADYIYDGIICLYNLALETLFNIATLNIYYANCNKKNLKN